MGYTDLHVHSNISDGTLSPRELVRYAAEKGVETMALTDHDSMRGVPEAFSEAELLNGEGIAFRLLAGVEMSVGFQNRDIHILGYFPNYERCMSRPDFTELAEDGIKRRELRNEQMAERFRAAGIPVYVDELRRMSGSEVITRAHFASWLTEHGYSKTNNDAFAKYIGEGCEFYVPRVYISQEEAIENILAAGGIPVLAHPMIYGLGKSTLEELIIRLKGIGLMGIETYYSTYVGNDEDTVRHLALKYDLVMTGGSDFHGANKPQIEIGTGRGNLKVPASCYDSIMELLG